LVVGMGIGVQCVDMGTLADLIPLLYDVDLEQLYHEQITPDETLGRLQDALRAGEVGAAMALLDAEIARLRPLHRLMASDAVTMVRKDPERGLDLPLYLSDLHCRRARLRMRRGELAGARADLVAAQVLPHVHPEAAPLLVEVYEKSERVDLAMSFLSRVHRDDPLSQAIGLLRLTVNGRRAGCDDSTVALGLDLLTAADRWKLFAGMVSEHAAWSGPPPDEGTLARLDQDLVQALKDQDLSAAKHLAQRLLAWTVDVPALWWVLGDLLERESGHLRTASPTDRFAVLEVPDDTTLLHAAADAFHVSAYFGPDELATWTALSAARLALGEMDAAAIAADRALAVEPEDPESHWLMAMALHGLGRGEEALSEIYRAAELDPTFEPATQVLDRLDTALAEERAGHE
jgi:tetratricopeptide (TPR) repeat protein